MTIYARCISICIVEISHFGLDTAMANAPHGMCERFIRGWDGRPILADGNAFSNRFGLSQYNAEQLYFSSSDSFGFLVISIKVCDRQIA